MTTRQSYTGPLPTRRLPAAHHHPRQCSQPSSRPSGGQPTAHLPISECCLPPSLSTSWAAFPRVRTVLSSPPHTLVQNQIPALRTVQSRQSQKQFQSKDPGAVVHPPPSGGACRLPTALPSPLPSPLSTSRVFKSVPSLFRTKDVVFLALLIRLFLRMGMGIGTPWSQDGVAETMVAPSHRP